MEITLNVLVALKNLRIRISHVLSFVDSRLVTHRHDRLHHSVHSDEVESVKNDGVVKDLQLATYSINQ